MVSQSLIWMPMAISTPRHDMKNFILSRLREPSTWAGLSVIATILGAPPGSVDLVHQIVAGVAGLVAIAAPEAVK